MKTKFKKLISSLFFVFMLAGCAPTGEVPDETSPVTIQSIELADDYNGGRVMQAKRLDGDSDEHVTNSAELDLTNSDETQDGDIQYVVIYKSLQEISFKITLDNPEAKSIDAIRLRCDDPESKIQIDGEFKTLAKEADGSRVVNWASEDAYEKTYKIQLQSEEYLNTLAVTDIRLAGHEKFQSKEMDVKSLGRNELKIYKMEDGDFQHTFYTNTPEYYKETVVIGDTIQNLTVSGAGATIEGGYLTATENGTYRIEYDYVFADTLSEHIVVEKKVELLNITYTLERALENGASSSVLHDGVFLGCNLMINIVGLYSEELHHLDFYKENPEKKEKEFMFSFERNGDAESAIMYALVAEYPDNENYLKNEMNNAKLEGYTNFYIKIFNSYYLIDAANGVLVLEK